MHKISVIWAFCVKNELDIADYAKEYAYTAGKKIYTARHLFFSFQGDLTCVQDKKNLFWYNSGVVQWGHNS